VRQRSFLVHLPLVIGPPMPAVIVFHGGGQNAEDMIKHWVSHNPSYDMVIVCPQALVDPLDNLTHWYAARPGDVTVPTVDLAFVNGLLNWLAATGRVDMQRVYASGFSNGAAMTWQLSHLNAFVNRFRGFAPVSFTPSSAQLLLSDAAARNTPKPVAFYMGTADPHWASEFNGVAEPSPPNTVIQWLTRNRTLPADPPVLYSCTVEQPIDPFVVEQLYRPNPAVANSTAFLYGTGVNGGHCWPGTGNDPSGRGLVVRDIDWTKRVVSFWNTYAGMGLPSSPAWQRC
jgi:poly(3-hydroxybutyrate) depolymerase